MGTWEGMTEGTRVCQAGVTSGRECGDVLGKHYSPSYVPDGNRFVRTDYCGGPGDSGAGVFGAPDTGNPHRAFGIHSGGSSGPCSDPDDFSIFGHIEQATNALGVSLLLAP